MNTWCTAVPEKAMRFRALAHRFSAPGCLDHANSSLLGLFLTKAGKGGKLHPNLLRMRSWASPHPLQPASGFHKRLQFYALGDKALQTTHCGMGRSLGPSAHSASSPAIPTAIATSPHLFGERLLPYVPAAVSAPLAPGWHSCQLHAILQPA